MNEEISLISSPLDIDASWVEKALLSAGIEAGVQNVDIETVGTGQLGETRRFHISYKQRLLKNQLKLIGPYLERLILNQNTHFLRRKYRQLIKQVS